jgi:hypothetical protein
MDIRKCWIVGLLMLSPLMGDAADHVVLAVPARHDLVHLGFDFLAMFPRSMTLVCHAGESDTLSLERFDAAAGRWTALNRADWPALVADRLVLVGEGDAVNQLQATAAGAGPATVVDGRRLHEVANAVNSQLKLTPEQWRRLAATHQFTLVERNIEQRRYGRYGPPGRRTPHGGLQVPAVPDDGVGAVEATEKAVPVGGADATVTFSLRPEEVPQAPATAEPATAAAAKPVAAESDNPVAAPERGDVPPADVPPAIRPEDK